MGVRTMKRRHFLWSLLLTHIIPTSAVAKIDAIGAGAASGVAKRVASMARFPASAVRISQEDDAENHAAFSELALLQKLSAKRGWPPFSVMDQSDLTLQQAIGELVQDDFERAKTIQVNGWILSETEVLCCRLIASVDRCDEVRPETLLADA